jgi:enoyl-[acyl-carrier protein] reductase I
VSGIECGYGGGKVLDGALIAGVANDHSIAFGCAKASRELGADLAVIYATQKSKPQVEPLASEAQAHLVLPLDVGDAVQL